MSMIAHLSAFADRALRVTLPDTNRYVVTLMDRVSGRPHVIAGIPLTILTVEPDEVVADLMRNRDPERWDTRVQPHGGRSNVQ